MSCTLARYDLDNAMRAQAAHYLGKQPLNSTHGEEREMSKIVGQASDDAFGLSTYEAGEVDVGDDEDTLMDKPVELVAASGKEAGPATSLKDK